MNKTNASQLLNKGRTVVQLVTQLKNWPLFLYDAALTQRRASKKLFQYRYRSGVVMTVRAFTDDKWALTEVFMKRPYDHPRFHPLGPSPIIVDLGAHIGSFTVQTAQAIPRARLFALEPSWASYALLQQNVMPNNLTNVTTLRCAIAPIIGEVPLRVDPARSVFNSTVASAGNRRGTMETVPAWTLAQLMATYHLPRIDFLKCDIEGSEFDVFLRLPSAIWRKIKNIALEYHLFDTQHTPQELLTVFRNNNFEILEFTPPHPDIGLLKARLYQ